MTEHDANRFAEIMTGLAENFNGKLSGPGIDMRFAVFSEFSIEQVEGAAMACVRNRKYSNMPTVAELIECIEGSEEDHKVFAESQAQEVLMAARRHGKYSNVRFADPVTNAVVRQFFGGWLQICGLAENKLIWFTKDFVERYAAYKQRGVECTEVMRGIGTTDKFELIGSTPIVAIGGNTDGQKKVAAVVGGATFKQRQTFREGGPFHDLVEKDSAA